MKSFLTVRAALVAAFLAFIASGGYVTAQSWFLQPNTMFGGHVIMSQAEAAPTGVGCTITAGSTDTSGTCTASAASGSITFTSKRPDGTVGFASAPVCAVWDQSATSTVSMPVYTVSATAITLTTIISTHVLGWHCFARNGG